jgi:hypothetical protein
MAIGAAAGVITTIAGLAPHIKSLVDLGKIWLEKYNNNPNDPELKALWRQMQINRVVAISEFEEAAEESLARQADKP